MNWVHDVPEDGLDDHEGRCVAVMGNGNEPTPVQQKSSLPDGETGTNLTSAWWLYDGKSGGPRAVAVRAACACGWRSPEMFPIDFTDRGRTEGWAEHNDGPASAWTHHINSLLGTTVPPEVAETIATLRWLLTGLAESRPLAAITASTEVETVAATILKIAVTTARARPESSSWETIGQALGTSRQGAHQRFAKIPYPS